MAPKPLLVCGPLVRRVDRSSAVFWVEVSEPMEIVVECEAEGGSFGVPVTGRAWTVQVDTGHYAWVHVDWLLADTWYRYHVVGHCGDGSQRQLWPDSSIAGTALPSAFRTMPTWSLDPLRLAYGSCRKGFEPADTKAPATGPDALEGLASKLAREIDSREISWPHQLVLMGDQIYADDFSARLEREFGHELALTFTEFAEIYREAWTSRPLVRWMLSCVPTLMIFDDHEIDDDWNITSDWVRSRRTTAGLRQLTDGLMAYWIYQGAGNLPRNRWRIDERMRILNPLMEPISGDITTRLRRCFLDYVTGRRDASWNHSIDLAGTRLAFTDTRMHRKLTGRRLMMSDSAWSEFSQIAKGHPGQRVIVVTPGPLLLPQPLHDLESWVADKLENDPSIFERATTGLVGGVVGGIGGGLVGAGVGFLVGGPAGAAVGFGIGAGIGFGVGFTAGFFLEEIIEHILGGKIGDLDIELWPVFPTSFNRMTDLLEDLADGRGTSRKRFIAVLGGDIHFSYAMEATLHRTISRRQFWHLTLSPTGNLLDESRDDVKELKGIMAGDFSVRTELELMKMTGVYYRPGFVDDQLERLSWQPLRFDGDVADAGKPDEWASFGNFIGWLGIDGVTATYRYDRAETADTGTILVPCAGSSMLTI